jgi:hypothetical protein
MHPEPGRIRRSTKCYRRAAAELPAKFVSATTTLPYAPIQTSVAIKQTTLGSGSGLEQAGFSDTRCGNSIPLRLRRINATEMLDDFLWACEIATGPRFVTSDTGAPRVPRTHCVSCPALPRGGDDQDEPATLISKETVGGFLTSLNGN